MKLNILTLAIVAMTFTQICSADTNQIPVGIDDLLHRVEAATISAQREYSMNVHQTVLQTNTAAAATLLVGQQKPIEEEDFFATCSTSGLVRAVKGLSAKQ